MNSLCEVIRPEMSSKAQEPFSPAGGRSALSRAALASCALIVLATAPAPAQAALPPGTVVQQWNQIAEDTVVGSGAFQNEGLIYMAYVSAAVYDAVTSIGGRYEPYAPQGPSSFCGATTDV